MVETYSIEHGKWRKKHQMVWVVMDKENRLIDFDVSLKELDERAGRGAGTYFKLWIVPPIGERCLFTKEHEEDFNRVMNLEYTAVTKRGKKVKLYPNKHPAFQ